MADTAASTQSRTPRAGSSKRRANTVSTETENKLARAARSAQRLAQLSDASRDDSTLDMFPDDPTRATLEAMNIDIRQGTLHGFELPEVVLAAVGAVSGADVAASSSSSSSEAKAARRATREKADAAPVAALLDGLDVAPSGNGGVRDSAPVNDEAAADVTTAEAPGESQALQALQAAPTTPLTPAMAAATVARSVTALRQGTEPGAAPVTPATPAAHEAGAQPVETGKPVVPPQRFAVTFAKAASASSGTLAGSGAVPAKAVDSAPIEPVASSAHAASSVEEGQRPLPEASLKATSSVPGAAATPRSTAAFAAPVQDAVRSTPELDRARATAFADTVDALYGVISDQRRAATDHSRRMKWMLSVVVAALLVTVAIGITQTLLLMRLTRETTAQQHRIEEMMQNQQAAMTSLLDAHLAVANAANAANAANVAAAAPDTASAPAPVTESRQPAAVAPASRHSVKAHAHPHKPKAASGH
ncbi:hypothetical protein [Paraburkholderia sp.]|uniref:hypothetical protein n=1 Tax=Paraburkholderia sp. TaxID=1926495 RepID=UPI002F423D74